MRSRHSDHDHCLLPCQSVSHKMITEILVLVAYFIENCTGVALLETVGSTSGQLADIQEPFLVGELADPLDDFKEFDPDDTIFQEFDPPQHLQADPKAWKQSLPTFSKSFWECLKSVLLIQAVAGTLIGVVAVGIVVFDFSTVTWCYDETSNWYKMPKSVQHLRVTAQYIESFFTQFWVYFICCIMFPISLLQKLNLFMITLIAGFLDVIYRLNLHMFGAYQVSWKSFPLNGLFVSVMIIIHFRLARHFHPRSRRSALRVFLILSAQILLGLFVAYFLVYKFFHMYTKQSEGMKVIMAGLSPLMTAVPKVVCRLGAQKIKGIFHPGIAHVLAAFLYGGSAVVFRVMQAELSSIDLFIALGLAHAIIDLLERITITIRDNIWEYLLRLLRLQKSRPPRYRSPRSRRLIADVSIQIMMQETSALVTALGFINVYKCLYSEAKPFINYQIISDFFVRAIIGLSIDLFFNTLSLLIQTRVMNVAVNKVWKKKWRHHLVVNCVVVWMAVLYFSEHMFIVVRDKYDSTKHLGGHHTNNCSFPSFL